MSEVADFNEYVVPHLKKIADGNPTFGEWLQESVGENINIYLQLLSYSQTSGL